MNTYGIFFGWFLTNAVTALVLLLCWRQPPLGRVAVAGIFFVAAIANVIVVLRNPAIYLGFASQAIPPYRAFIEGPFFADPARVVLPIAAAQCMIAYLLLRDGGRLKLGIAGAIVFLVMIAPLGAGSAFPSTIILAFAAGLLLRRHARPFFHDFFPASPTMHALRHFPQ